MTKINKLDLLVSIYIFCIAVSELMGAKTFPLLTLGTFKLNSSVAIFVFPIIFSINDVITEVYGKQRTRSVIKASLLIIFLLFVFSLLATYLPPSTRFLNSEKAYDEVFFKSARLSAASLLAFGIADFLDVYIFSRLRERFGKRRLWLRTNVSNFVSQFTDTTVFMFLAFYALGTAFTNNFSFIFSLILPYWLLKCSMSVIETPFVYLGVRWLKEAK